MTSGALDIITPETAVSLAGLFRERLSRTPDAPAYYYFNHTAKSWQSSTWAEMADTAGRWQAAFINDGLVSGDRHHGAQQPGMGVLRSGRLGFGLGGSAIIRQRPC